MASKSVAFSPTLLPSKHPTTSGKSIGPFSVLFPSTRNPTAAHFTGDGNLRFISNNPLRRRWPLDAAPSGKSTAEKWEEEGLITESLPDGKFRVKLSNGDSILGYLSGKIRQRFIRVMPGDKVKIEFSRYDLSKGRITYRLRKDRLPEAEE